MELSYGDTKVLLAGVSPDHPNRAAQRGESTPGLATRPASRTQAPHWTPTPRRFCCMPTRARLTTRTKPAIAHLPRTTVPREIPLSSAAQLRAPPRLPHFTFASSDVKRREPPGKTARSSAEDRGSISARLAPAVDRDAQPAPRSRPERPRSREHEPRLTCNVRRCTVCFRGKCDVLAGYHATSAKTDTSIDYPLNIRRLC